MALQLPAGSSVTNKGVSGQTCAQMESDASTDIDPLRTGNYVAFVVVCFGGTNDIYFNADADDTGATTYGRIVTYCTNRRTAGWRVVVCSLLPRGDFPGGSTLPSVAKTHDEARRQAINSAIRNTWPTFADAFADVAADSRMGDDGDELDTTYYQGDKVHPTATGQLVLKDVIAGSVWAVISSLQEHAHGSQRPFPFLPSSPRPR